MMRFAPVGLSLVAVLGVGGCGQEYEAELPDARGLVERSPVVVAGVAVGEVERVRVVGEDVRVTLSVAREHALELREDACGRVGSHADQPALLIHAGAEGSLRGAIPMCDDSTDAVDAEPQAVDRTQARPVASEPDADEPNDTDEAASEAEDAVSDDPVEPEAPPAEDPPPPTPEKAKQTKKAKKAPKKKRARCAPGLRINISKAEHVAPTPLHLPDGGYRIKITFINPNGFAVEIGSASEALFIDDQRRGHRAEMLPGSDADWFLPFWIPAHGKTRVSVVLPDEGEGPPNIESVRYVVYCP